MKVRALLPCPLCGRQPERVYGRGGVTYFCEQFDGGRSHRLSVSVDEAAPFVKRRDDVDVAAAELWNRITART